MTFKTLIPSLPPSLPPSFSLQILTNAPAHPVSARPTATVSTQKAAIPASVSVVTSEPAPLNVNVRFLPCHILEISVVHKFCTLANFHVYNYTEPMLYFSVSSFLYSRSPQFTDYSVCMYYSCLQRAVSEWRYMRRPGNLCLSPWIHRSLTITSQLHHRIK